MLLERRSQFHHARLIEHLTPYDAPFVSNLHALTQVAANAGQSLISPATRALAMIDAQAQAQATMLAYLDVFKIMALGCVPIIFLCLMLKKMKHHDAQMGH
jgi:DHA2 family multidrug resistance protein